MLRDIFKCWSSCTLFQNDFYSVSNWSLDWQLHFNLCKCSCLHVGNTNGQHNYQIMNRPILSTETEKNLGILTRYDLKSSSHVSFIVQKAGKCLAILNRNIVSRDKTVFLKLYKHVVGPHLELAVCVWNPHLVKDIELIEIVQHKATKCISGLHSKSYAERLQILQLDSLKARRCMIDTTEAYKILHNGSDTCNLKFFELSTTLPMCGHNFKLKKFRCRLNCHKHFFLIGK